MYMKNGTYLPEKGFIPTNSIYRLKDMVCIPFDEMNIDYQKYLEWLEDGNEPIDLDISLLNLQ